MKFHDAANIFPLMADDEIDSLAKDIDANGLLHPVETLDGQILDGRNRWLACLRIGHEPATIDVDLDGMTPTEYVVSLNLHRRHLSESQRAMVAARIKPKLAEEAKERQHMGRPSLSSLSEVPHNCAEGNGDTKKKGDGDARKMAGDLFNVSHTHVDRAAKVIDKGTPDLVGACDAGQIPVSVGEKIADKPEAVQVEIVRAIVLDEKTPAAALRDANNQERREQLESVEAMTVKEIDGVYDVIVIDPPWPIDKIERDLYPDQTKQLDYPTMSLDEIGDLELPAADDCMLWLWTTQRFLEQSFQLVHDWDFDPRITFVWHKPGGFQPVGLPQYNCEFVIYAVRGRVQFLDTKNFPVCFNAPRGRHSEKPEQFYEMLRRVTGGRRIDMFNRRPIDGFDGWGKES